eukprot:TRINITY_DN3018_c0_g1_i3.p2 TRINITY_DN3018_c0_g1~~TRINITY_DN3018_c0_g1_i3.p2  ORF type:complete len:120 (-),score=59.18 TRINITY_DN3018_c0_g1_i3:355-714(-)
MYDVFFFFFKQKTAYEMLRSLVGSEMCIRDRTYIQLYPRLMRQALSSEFELNMIGLRPGLKLREWVTGGLGPVSYAVFAAQGIDDTVAELHREAREAIMEEYKQVDVDDADEEVLRFVD